VRGLWPAGAGIALSAIVLALVWLMLRSLTHGDLIAAWATFAVSVVVMVLGLLYGVLPDTEDPAIRQPTQLLWLTPVVIFGFALCPYLDLTFHRARQALTPGRARAAFSVGFGTFFLLMIIFTLGNSWIARLPLSRLAAVLLLLHMGTQIGFTVAVHLRELPRLNSGVVAALLIGAIAAAVPVLQPSMRGLDSGELIYRLFMGCYGLVFPAYVLLQMIPAPRRDFRMFVLAVAVASPLFWLGFVEQQTLWLVPGIVILLAFRLILHWPWQKMRVREDALG
jgi:hypothetical protein